MCDGEFVRSAQAGDREAFGELVARYQGLVYGLCCGMTGNVPDAEDLTHEALVEAFLKLYMLRDPERFAQLVRDAEDEATLQNLALALRHWGSFWMGISPVV